MGRNRLFRRTVAAWLSFGCLVAPAPDLTVLTTRGRTASHLNFTTPGLDVRFSPEWKEWKPAVATTKGLREAEAVGFETTRTRVEPTDQKTGTKKYRRSDLISLNANNPDKYQENAEQITRAYMKGEVDLNA